MIYAVSWCGFEEHRLRLGWRLSIGFLEFQDGDLLGGEGCVPLVCRSGELSQNVGIAPIKFDGLRRTRFFQPCQAGSWNVTMFMSHMSGYCLPFAPLPESDRVMAYGGTLKTNSAWFTPKPRRNQRGAAWSGQVTGSSVSQISPDSTGYICCCASPLTWEALQSKLESSSQRDRWGIAWGKIWKESPRMVSHALRFQECSRASKLSLQQVSHSNSNLPRHVA